MKKSSIEDVAHACAIFKNELVAKDFHDKGERALLNLGHTLGHAFESTLKIPHGQAVTLGLKFIFKIMGQNEALANWEKMARALSLPVEKYDL